MRSKILEVLAAGCLGDAYGYPVEFLQWDVIQKRYGTKGLLELLPNPDIPVATDDTQMTLFIAESILQVATDLNIMSRHDLVESAELSMLDWYHTQLPADSVSAESLLLQFNKDLCCRRAPGNTCLSSLQTRNYKPTYLDAELNNSKGCGVVMRSAPYAFLHKMDGDSVWATAGWSGYLTHCHPDGWGSGAALAYLMHKVLAGASFEEAIKATSQKCAQTAAVNPKFQFTGPLLEKALAYSLMPDQLDPDRMCNELGEAWTGDEALAVSVYAALRAKSVLEAIQIGTNHRGDSDSTASIAGQLAALRFGMTDDEYALFKQVDLAPVVEYMAEQLFQALEGF